MTKLKDIKFFDKLSENQLEKLKQISSYKSYEKGEILFFEGDEPKFIYILTSGILKLFKTDAKSHQLFLHQLYPVNFVAELANFENIPYPATAEFINRGEVIKIDYEKFLNQFLMDKNISLNIIKSLSNKLKILSEVLHKELVLSSDAKIAKFLVENSDIFNMTKNVKVASLLNLSPETLSRILSKFKNKGLIEFDSNNKLIVTDEKKLLELYE